MAQCLRPLVIKAPERTGWRPRTHYISVPCGKCPVCLKKRQQDWAIRMEKETDFIDSNGGCCYFTSLTYKDEALPYDEETGCITLYKKDAQKFIETFKRRFKYRFGIVPRYFCCGEYGDSFGRPHLHFMLWFPGIRLRSEEIRPYIEDCWQDGIVLGVHPFSTKLAEYIAKYSTKQQGVDYNGIQEPFALMSLKPAIGKCWVDNNREFYLNNPHPFLTDRSGVRFSLPRYYRSRVYDLKVYYNYVDACIQQHDLELQCKLDFYGNTSFLRDIDQAHERFIELFWSQVKTKRNLF